MVDQAVLDPILREIERKRTAGVAHCGLSEKTTLPEAAIEFGLLADRSIYRQIDAEQARRIMVRILHRDLAYNVEIMSVSEAERLANAVLLGASQRGTALFSNGDYDEPEERSVGWRPATQATFDTGVLLVSEHGSACVWFEDED